jgi:hypothetical protein
MLAVGSGEQGDVDSLADGEALQKVLRTAAVRDAFGQLSRTISTFTQLLRSAVPTVVQAMEVAELLGPAELTAGRVVASSGGLRVVEQALTAALHPSAVLGGVTICTLTQVHDAALDVLKALCAVRDVLLAEMPAHLGAAVVVTVAGESHDVRLSCCVTYGVSDSVWTTPHTHTPMHFLSVCADCVRDSTVVRGVGSEPSRLAVDSARPGAGATALAREQQSDGAVAMMPRRSARTVGAPSAQRALAKPHVGQGEPVVVAVALS